MDDGDTLWFSFMTVQGMGGSNPDFGFALGTDPGLDQNNIPLANSGNGLGVRIKDNQIRAAAWVNGAVNKPVGAGFSAGTTYLIVGEIIFGAETDTINLYLPDTDLNLGDVVSTTTATLDQTAFDTITFVNKTTSPRDQIDEIRFGATYQDAIGQGGAVAPNDYDEWTAGHPTVDLSDPDGDSDGDGLTNNEERLWGLDPANPGSLSPISAPFDPEVGTLTYTRRDTSLTDASYSYQWTTTLADADWTSFTPAAEDSDEGSPVETVTITVPAVLLSNPGLFLRVVATED